MSQSAVRIRRQKLKNLASVGIAQDVAPALGIAPAILATAAE
jgi:hypothetical protein